MMTRCSLLLICALMLTGCDSRQVGPRQPDENWKGTIHVDPAGDVGALQGKWKLYQSDGTSEVGKNETYLVFEGNVIIFDFVTARERGNKPDKDVYNFSLNSSLDPKVIRYTQRLGEGEPLVHRRAPLSRWYRLDGDDLWIRDNHEGMGELNKVIYHRIQTVY